MIERVEIRNPDRTPVEWWPKVEELQGFAEFNFFPGINIIWGPNGSGKSTLLNAIAHLTHSKQSGRSVVTRQSVSHLDKSFGGKELSDGMHLFGDGQSVLYFSPQDSVGLIGGMAGFDYEFMDEGVQSMFHYKISAGQSAMAKLGEVMKHQGKEVQWKVPEDQERPVHDFIREILSCRLEAGGQQTLIMDEPDANMDWTNRYKLWNIIQDASKFQFIIATHSPFGLRCPGAHYIDLKKDYRVECAVALRLSGLWTEKWGRENDDD